MFSEQSIAELLKANPGLTRTEPETVEGVLLVDAVYNDKRLSDKFNVRITEPKALAYLPTVFEIGGRTEAIATKWNVTDLRSLHINTVDGSICLCAKQDEKKKCPPGSELLDFIQNLVVPYFFGLLWFEMNKKWPWGEYSHGSVGLFEYYSDVAVGQPTVEETEEVLKVFRQDQYWKEILKQLTKPRAKRECPCGRQIPFKKCHPRALKGLRRFRAGLIRLNTFPPALSSTK